MNRDKIVSFCENILKPENFKDYCHNGLQVEGSENIKKICVGVSLTMQFIEEAIKRKAQMLIIHHGFFNKENARIRITGCFKKRLKLLLENNLNVVGFHLPLDAQPQIGNNASICKLLGVKAIKPCNVGFVGEFAPTLTFEKLLQKVEEKLVTEVQFLHFGPEKVKKIGVISGGASYMLDEVVNAGADTFLCGDLRESVYWQAQELKVNLINAGHYNTERLGVFNLGREIAKKFKLPVEFIETPCSI